MLPFDFTMRVKFEHSEVSEYETSFARFHWDILPRASFRVNSILSFASGETRINTTPPVHVTARNVTHVPPLNCKQPFECHYPAYVVTI